MKKLVYLLGLLTVIGVVSSCSNGNDNQQNLSCPVNTSYYNGACYTNQGGAYVQGGNFNYGNGFYADNYSGMSSLRVVNGAKMQEFFKLGMGVCDRAAISGGQASCDSWVGGAMGVIIQFPSAGASSLLATFFAQPRYNPYVNYSYQLPSGFGVFGMALGALTGIYIPDPKQYNGAIRNPLQLEMAVSAINNSVGFSANGYGDYWTGLNRTKLTIEVAQGKVESNQFNFIFKVADTPAAQGTFTRCQTFNCGM